MAADLDQQAPSAPMSEQRKWARDRLIQSAMRHFGERGVSVPMVEISTAAGHRNKSAVAYHFNDKKGLINAVYTEIMGFLVPRFERVLAELETMPTERLSLYEIGLGLNAPFFALYCSEPSGEDALKTLARLGYESHGEQESMYLRFLPNIFTRFAALIQKKVPHKPAGQLKLHLTHYLLATVNGLAHTERWEDLNFRANPDLVFELMLSYTDYVAGGIGGASSGRPAFDAQRWRHAIDP